MRYQCPYCNKPMPIGLEPATWAHCGEIGHAVGIKPGPRQSAATDKALKLVAKGLSVAAAARKAGISWTTLYRAQERLGTRVIKRRKA